MSVEKNSGKRRVDVKTYEIQSFSPLNFLEKARAKPKMNGTSPNCVTSVVDFSNFAFRQLVSLTLFNVALILVIVITNAFVIYILIKTKQMSNVTCRLILVLSVSDMLLGVFAQALFTIESYNANCFVVTACLFVSVFLTHVSAYTIAIIGIDRYIRIKYFVNFKAI